MFRKLRHITQTLNDFFDKAEKHIAIWQLKQELSSFEYAQQLSQRPQTEVHVLATLKLRSDLENLKERRFDKVGPRQLEKGCHNQTCFQEKAVKIAN